MELPAELETRIDEVITQYPVSRRSAALPLLHLIQEHYGYIEDDAFTWIASKLDLQPWPGHLISHRMVWVQTWRRCLISRQSQAAAQIL